MYRRNPRKTDLNRYTNSFANELKNFPSDFSSPKLVDKAAKFLEAAVISSFELSCLARRVQGRSRDPWWDDQSGKRDTWMRRIFVVGLKAFQEPHV